MRIKVTGTYLASKHNPYAIGMEMDVIDVQSITHESGEIMKHYRCIHEGREYCVFDGDCEVIDHSKIIDWEQRLFDTAVSVWNSGTRGRSSAIFAVGHAEGFIRDYRKLITNDQ